jgi:hypothetical protein
MRSHSRRKVRRQLVQSAWLLPLLVALGWLVTRL